MRLPRLMLLLLFGSTIQAAKPKDAILLSQVRTLTLYANAKTSHRRVPAVPQLTCKGPGCAFYKVDTLRCKNQGSSYSSEDIEWSCTANLPKEFKLGSTDVVCEGYSNRDDKYVLKGSCGVIYRLLLTELGEEKYAHYIRFGKRWTSSTLLFVGFFLLILFWILYTAFKALRIGDRLSRLGGFWGGGGGGGGDGYPWGPPPPYPGKRNSNNQQQTEWLSSFLTGTLGGAAAGYLAGRRSGGRNFPHTQRSQEFYVSRDTDEFGSSSVTNTSSSARYESTGFGSTSRR